MWAKHGAGKNGNFFHDVVTREQEDDEQAAWSVKTEAIGKFFSNNRNRIETWNFFYNQEYFLVSLQNFIHIAWKILLSN